MKRAYIVCFTIFKRDIFCSSLLASDFCYRGKKLRVLNIIDIFRHHPSTPLITLLTMSGTWDQEETKMAAETRASLQWLHRLVSTSTPWLKRLTIFWRIFRRLAYFHVWKCATSATGNNLTMQHKVCCPGRYIDLKVGFPLSRFGRNIIETIIPLINVRTEISKRLPGFL